MSGSRNRAFGRQSLCTFWLHDFCFGIEVLTVQEVIRHHDLTPVPLAPRVVSGLMNLRGQIITVVDLRRRMELPDRVDGVGPMHVVIHNGDVPVSLTVDRIGDVVEVSSDLFETPPGTVTGAAREVVKGAYKLDGRLLLELDTERVLADLATSGPTVGIRSS